MTAEEVSPCFDEKCQSPDFSVSHGQSYPSLLSFWMKGVAHYSVAQGVHTNALTDFHVIHVTLERVGFSGPIGKLRHHTENNTAMMAV